MLLVAGLMGLLWQGSYSQGCVHSRQRILSRGIVPAFSYSLSDSPASVSNKTMTHRPDAWPCFRQVAGGLLAPASATSSETQSSYLRAPGISQ